MIYAYILISLNKHPVANCLKFWGKGGAFSGRKSPTQGGCLVRKYKLYWFSCSWSSKKLLPPQNFGPDLACSQDPSFQSSKEPLPEQTLALEMMQKFHRSMTLYIYQCSVSWGMALENKPQATRQVYLFQVFKSKKYPKKLFNWKFNYTISCSERISRVNSIWRDVSCKSIPSYSCLY